MAVPFPRRDNRLTLCFSSQRSAPAVYGSVKAKDDRRVYRSLLAPTNVLGSVAMRRCHCAPGHLDTVSSTILRITSEVPSSSPTPVMSQTPAESAAPSTSSISMSSFQAIFQAALKSYKKQTKKDLLTHPLASQLQSCESTTAILAILQGQVREFEKNSEGDERLMKWLGPTVNVLNAFSATVSGGVSLVRLDS